MGLLINGVWHDQWYDTEKSDGAFIRSESQFRNAISADGNTGFKAQANRYHLYVSLACPWAHRTLIFRKLKKLEHIISVSAVAPHMLQHGWAFDGSFDSDRDSLNNTDFLHQIYTKAKPDYSGRVTVPVLWDKHLNTIVNNESAEIIRMFNSEFQAFTDVTQDYYPAALRSDIDSINEFIYHNINNGVYKCGFATRQHAYERAYADLFAALDELEHRLDRQPYLVGHQLTEADWRLFTTLIRFDAVYVGHFKCNRQRIADFPNLSNYLRALYQIPGVSETVNLTHIKQHYYYSHETINPTRIVPQGPQLNFDASHNRSRFDSPHHKKRSTR